MPTNYVIAVLENSAGQKFFDRIMYFPQEEKVMINRRMALLDTFGYKATLVKMPLVGLDLNCKWDIFLVYAMAYGVPNDLACLGRECIRKAHMHDWKSELQAQYHLAEAGGSMIQFALQEPARAREIWSGLIRTEGGKS